MKTSQQPARITLALQAAIVAELQEWAEGSYGKDLKWDFLTLKYGFSRTSLWKNPEIRNAFTIAKEALRKGVKPKDKIDDLTLMNSKLQEENERLKKQLLAYQAKWVTWFYNASQRGMTEDDLSREILTSFVADERKNRRR